MERSWLIQRMNKPTGMVNPFAFGGGGSGFHPDVADQLKDVCSWDYMGSAEYEFGAPAKSLNRMISGKKELVSGSMIVSYNYTSNKWLLGETKKFDGSGNVFYICRKDVEIEVKTRIHKFAKDYQYRATREPVYLDASLSGEMSYCGWFDIDNDFMFFTDETMWKEFCSGLEVKV